MYFSCAFKVKGGEWLRQENNQIVKIKARDSTVLYKKEKTKMFFGINFLFLYY